jgi:hypothetical protein
MFNNAFLYNDQGSVVYEDAARLKALFLFYMGKGPDPTSPNAFPALGNVTLVDEIKDQATGEVYRVGDYVYIPPAGAEGLSTSSTIMLIVQVWRDNIEGDKLGFTGCWFLRPEQTMHKATHVFMENEVFQTHHMIHYGVGEISGRAIVLHLKDYVRGKPKGFDIGDVYVCESKYVEPSKVYQKLKSLVMPEGVQELDVALELYEMPIVPKKVPSIWHEQATAASKGKKRKSSVGAGDDIAVVDKAAKVCLEFLILGCQGYEERLAGKICAEHLPKRLQLDIPLLSRPIACHPSAYDPNSICIPTSLVAAGYRHA